MSKSENSSLEDSSELHQCTILPLYYINNPPKDGVDLLQLLRALSFINGWYPPWVSTTNGWSVVPGGWSISCEFTFYVLFPILAVVTTSLSRSILLFTISMAFAIWMNVMFEAKFNQLFGVVATSNYLYFWLPNQMPIFSMGFIVYYLVADSPIEKLQRGSEAGIGVALVILIIVMSLFYQPNYQYLRGVSEYPAMFYAAVIFVLVFIVMSCGGFMRLNGGVLQKIGEWSFSMYLIHFIVLEKCQYLLKKMIGDPLGITAIFAFLLLWISVVTISAFISRFTYEFIEKPGNRVAKVVNEELLLRV